MVPRRRAAVALLIAATAALASRPGAGDRVAAQALTLEEVLFRANETVVEFERQFGTVQAEEVSRSRIVSGDGEVRRSRDLRGHVLFFRAPAADTWTLFRDVVEVDGRPFGSAARPDRPGLPELLEAPGPGLMPAVERLHQESEEQYFGPAMRWLTPPTLALLFLHPLHQHRASFEKVGEEVVGDRTVWHVRFHEQRRPSVFRLGRRELFARGAFWIEPTSGRVVRSMIEFGDVNSSARIHTRVTVQYRFDEGLGTWVPASLEELHDDLRRPRDNRVEGTSEFRNFRSVSLPAVVVSSRG